MSRRDRSSAGRAPARSENLRELSSAEIDEHAELYQVAYEESQRTLDDQQDELNHMRDRSVSYVSFVGAATAFLVGTGLTHSDRDWLFYLLAGVASVLTLAMIVFAWLLLNPSNVKPWSYRLSARVLIADWIEKDVPAPTKAELVRELAVTYDEMQTDNEVFLSNLRTLYRNLITSGVAQLVFWGALVWVKT
jgi:hypothetical protein